MLTSEPDLFFLSVRGASRGPPLFLGLVEIYVKGEKTLHGDAVKFGRSVLKLNDDTAADHFGTDLFAKCERLLDRLSGPKNIVDDYGRVHFALAEKLTELAFTVFHFGPVDLLGRESFAYAESDHDAAGAGADDGDLRQLAGDGLFHSEQPAESDRQY